MTESLRIAGVSERDIDLFLFEELIASSAFRDWVLDATSLGKSRADTVLSVRRGVTHSTGESDLELDVILSDGRAGRLLIENKVDAALRTRQAERYAERAAAYVAGGQCDVASTLLVAPERYFGEGDDAAGFDASMTYEKILNWLDQSGLTPERRSYKRALLTAAIEKAALGYQPVADDAMSSIWRNYSRLVDRLAPELNMPAERGRPSGSHFVFFKPDGFPKGVLLVHKFAYGRVDVEFAGWGDRIGALRAVLTPLMPEQSALVRAGKSAAVRRAVPRVSVAAAPEVQAKNMEVGILAARDLLAWFRQHRTELARIYEGPV